ncbi:DUF1254 domain-containing protein [Prescottella soli]|uniref:DUF1254 domain-containing protein n=1 Tax=Prescottella soli TaxID=1543852 RepID=A0ABW9FVC2_9NOCA
MKRNKALLSCAIAASVLVSAGCASAASPSAHPTFDMERTNYPSEATKQALYDELDYQRAVQSYIWAQPLVGLASMAEGAREIGIEPMELFIFDQLEQVNQKLQTGNDDVVYSFSYFDLSQTGPMVVEIPANGQYGVILDAWQRPTEDVGGVGPDHGAGGKYLVIPPGYQGPLPRDGYFVSQAKTNTGMLFLRAVRGPGDSVASAADRLRATNLYPYSQVDNPPAPRNHNMGHDDYNGLTRRGLDYYTLMAKALRTEAPEERDRMMYGMLAPLGIKPGEAFEPDERVRAILERAADTGRKMVANLEVNSRTDRPSVYPNTQWRNPTGMTHYSQELGAATELDERAALFRYGFAMQKFLDPNATPPVNTGAAYLTSYRDSDGVFLDGSNEYRLHIPANAPIRGYWSASLYDAEDFSFIDTDQKKPSLSSLKDLTKNPDGSIDLVFSPNEPEDPLKSNWIKTIPQQGFLVLFRLYAPTEDYYAGKWPLADISRTNRSDK